MNGHPLPPKKEVVRALLEGGRSVYIHLDPRAIGVVVPAWFKRQPQLVLQVGFNMPVPIPDLRVDDDGMSCTLSFNRSAFFCIIPWSSVYATVGEDGRGMVWPDDVPPEVALQARQREASPAAMKAPPARKANLAVVKSPPPPSDATAAKEPVAPRTLRSGSEGAMKAKKPRARKPAEAAAPVAPAVSAAPRARASSKTARGDKGRGALVAVPSAKRKPQPAASRESSPPPERPKAAAAPETPPPAAQKPQTPPKAAAAPKPGSKAKREIPPYLRVVK